MAAFSYQARSAGGEKITGRMEAENIQDAAYHLQEQGLFITELHPILPRHSFFSRLPFADKAYFRVNFCRRLAMLLEGNLSLEESVRILAESASGRERELLWDIVSYLHGGGTLAAAMERHAEIFPATMAAVLRAGDQAGHLDQVLFRLAVHGERAYRLQEKFKTTLAYPALLLVLTAAAGSFFLVVVLPVFAALLEGMQRELPLPTKFLLWASHFVSDAGWGLPIGIILAVLLLRAIFQSPGVRTHWGKLRLRIPVFGRLEEYMELERLMETLSVMVGSGILLHEALELMSKATENLYLRSELQQAAVFVRQGMPLSEVLEGRGGFPSFVTSWIRTGEMTGDLEQVLRQIADFCSFEGEMRAKRVETLAEPVILLAVGGVVAFFVLSVALPLFELMSVTP
ncbi:type II secretion system F family protein [Selenomonas sp. TAMA-11512]|uniref:type II secretion system F family protein n=1 Tax=Selenomonas sp. TAMA-11512 TaxID=3095337 RepID=UPI003085AD97|nr:type II secretion system F family protein [Selenomonas sp. TAMA-11512]